VKCGYVFIFMCILSTLINGVMYFRVKNNHLQLIEKLGWTTIFSSFSFTPKCMYFVIVDHWKHKDILLSILCVLILTVDVVAVMTMFESKLVCSGKFTLDA
jgi:hypothetical protein